MIDANSTARATLVAAALGFSALMANAQSGFFVEGGIGIGAATTKLTESEPGFRATTDIGKSRALGSLGAGWRWTSPTTVFGVGAFGNLAGRNIGEITVTDPAGSVTGKLEQRNHWGIGVEAGWRLAPPTTLYGKLTWNRANFKATLTETAPPDVFTDSISNNHAGVGLGVGLRHALSANSYVFAEWQHVNFNRRTRVIDGISYTVDPSNSIGLVGLGWTF